ncbi:MAG: iron-containing alcohol dehydrogenase [archaeon]|nr:iron-containing alcohol dehydrogenase [archaeon]
MIRKKSMIKRIWNNPQVYYRKGAIGILKEVEYKEILLMIAEPIKKLEYYSKIEKFLAEKTVRIEVFEKINQDEISELREKYQNSKLEAIIAIGGGSIIDPAKILRVLLDHPEKSFEDLKNDQFLNKNEIKLVVIPTTPSTGSEATSTAVITDKDGIKTPYVNLGFLPDLAILDHNFLKSIPKNNIFEFGADIFAHAYEGSLSLAGSPLLKAMAKTCLTLLESGFMKLNKDPEDLKALSDILYSGHIAGIVQGNAFVGVCHALAHAMEQLIQTSHSSSILSLIKPIILWMNETKPKPEYEEFLKVYDSIGFDNYKNSEIIKTLEPEKWAEAALKDPSISTSPIRMKKENLMELIQWIQKQE